MLRASRQAAKFKPPAARATSGHYLYYNDLNKFRRVKENLDVASSVVGTAGFIKLRSTIDHNLLRPEIIRQLERAVNV